MRMATSSMSSVPKPLKILKEKYDSLKEGFALLVREKRDSKREGEKEGGGI